MLNARRLTGENGEILRQTLREHSREVAEMTEDTCGKVNFPKLGRLGGLLHDVGKSPQSWQNYMEEEGKCETVGHSLPGASFLIDFLQEQASLEGMRLRQMLALAIHGHHGGLHDVLRPDGESGIPDYAASQIDTMAQEHFFQEVASRQELAELFQEASAEIGRTECDLRNAAKAVSSDRVTYLNAYQMFLGLRERFFYASLIDADRYDAARWEEGRPRGDWRRNILDWGGMGEQLRNAVDQIPSEDRIPQLRQKIAAQCRAFHTEKQGIYRAFIPTGGGKTLSVMALALNAAKDYSKDHVFFIEPFLTILEQNAADVRDKCGAGDQVLEHHSNVLFEDDENDEKLTAWQKRSERWDAPIVFTSLVQLMNALYAGKSSAARRMCALANSVIIIDEVQAVPRSSQYLFNLGVSFLTQICGCIVVLCTATPPTLEKLAYPLRPRCDIVPGTEALYAAFRRTKLDTSMVKNAVEPEKLGEFIVDRQLEEGSVLVIMNTKALAKSVWKAVQKRTDVPVYYLSTSLCAAHRTTRLDEIRALLNAGKPVVCVTTQLIEAGVDISFPCVVRSLAGMDSILQAAGRCNRHGKAEEKTVYVVKCAGEERALAFLPEIAAGQEASQRMMAESELYAGDLQSPAAITGYYTHLFASQIDSAAMAYPLNLPGYGKGFNAVDLLGINRMARQEYEKLTGRRIPLDQLAQSFRTAGTAYHPIPEDTVGVLVPWKAGAQMIERLRIETDPKERKKLLQRLQQYSVNLFSYELKALWDIGAVTADPQMGVYVLDTSHYSDTSGVTLDDCGSVNDYFL